ncbi:hypothetical protein, partial [Citrobacter freundii]|uniref:hypothetical protein n=1 Tax=Citrobacter freundii TaxID=546 RepID=UPI0030DD592E
CYWPQARALPLARCHWTLKAPPRVPTQLRARAPAHRAAAHGPVHRPCAAAAISPVHRPY